MPRFTLVHARTLLALLALAALPAASARATEVFTDNFDSYTPGSPISSPWVLHSGTVAPGITAAGRAQVSFDPQDGDVNAPLTGGPHGFGVGKNNTLYIGFRFRWTAAPTSDHYFIALRTVAGAGAGEDRGRVFLRNQGGGNCRLGVSNGSGSVNQTIALDLASNTEYIVIVRYSMSGTDPNTTVWINPASEATTSNRTVAGDVISNLDIAAVLLRQHTSGGTVELDDLTVATTFSESYPDQLVFAAANPQSSQPLPTSLNVAMSGVTATAYGAAFTIQSITVSNTGTGSAETDIAASGVKIIRDISNFGVYDVGTDTILATGTYSGGGASVTITINLNIPANSTDRLLIVYDFNGNGSPGETFTAAFASAVIAAGLQSGLPVTGTTQTLRDPAAGGAGGGGGSGGCVVGARVEPLWLLALLASLAALLVVRRKS